MAWFVRLDAQEDFDWLKHLIDSAVRKATHTDPGRFELEQIEIFLRLQQALEGAVVAHAADFSGGRRSEQTNPLRLDHATPAQSKVKVKPEPTIAAKLCATHLFYGARNRPRTECKGCWDAFERMNGAEATKLARRRYAQKGRATTQ